MTVFEVDRDTPMPAIPLKGGMLPLLPAAFYDSFPQDSLWLWCHTNARYGLPTVELVEWLQEKIAGRKAIEVGAGSGDLAHHLGIQPTDNRMQEWPHIRAHYAGLRQPVIQYGDRVASYDALDAVDFYKPEVVIASWVTEWIDPFLPPPPHGGNAWGVKEDRIVAQCDYILIGNAAVHGKKKIMEMPHEEHALPFLRSRAFDQSLDRMWIWRKE